MSVQKALEWLKAAELPTGGIACWQDENGHFLDGYPEVTGYLIPTMYAYGLHDLAVRCADWLITVQHESGAFPGIDGVPRSFDTGAVVEGLQTVIAHGHASEAHYDAVDAALDWMDTQRYSNGTLAISAMDASTHIYTMRSSWIMNDLVAAIYWAPDNPWDDRWGERQRPHYIGYALDGLDRLGYNSAVRLVLQEAQTQPLSGGLMPLWSYGWQSGEGSCTTSTLQFAILNRRHGLEYRHLIDAAEQMQDTSGGFYHDQKDKRRISWALKFYLDAMCKDLYV